MESNVLEITDSDIKSMLSMIRRMKNSATAPSVGVQSGLLPAQANSSVNPTSFADILRTSLHRVNAIQIDAQQLADQFTAGNDKISVSDVLLGMRKADINLQLTVQVRNKLAAAYNEIMNMQI